MNRLIKNALLATGLVATMASPLLAEPADTLILKFGNNSSIVIQLNDKKDLELIRKYDINDMLRQLQIQVDSSSSTNFLLKEGDNGVEVLQDTTIYYAEESDGSNSEGGSGSDEPFSRTWVWEDNDDDDNEYGGDFNKRFNKDGKRRHYNDNDDIQFDFGTNNWLQNNQLPDETGAAYAVRPWGSWYFAINSVQKTKIAGPLYLNWGLGVSWYNFRFSDADIRMEKEVATKEITFKPETDTEINSIKSKLTVPYLNANFVPKLNFGKSGDGFRIGVGGYAGYRIGGYTKIVYEQGNDKQKDKDRDSFYMNSWRYGARVELGWRDFDMFINYDINTIFADNNNTTPKLNAFSIGISI